jgi:hypothetical protein
VITFLAKPASQRVIQARVQGFSVRKAAHFASVSVNTVRKVAALRAQERTAHDERAGGQRPGRQRTTPNTTQSGTGCGSSTPEHCAPSPLDQLQLVGTDV